MPFKELRGSTAQAINEITVTRWLRNCNLMKAMNAQRREHNTQKTDGRVVLRFRTSRLGTCTPVET